MYTVEAEDLNKLYASHRLTVTADTGSDDFVKAKKYVISYLRTLRNKNNDDCVTITGNEQLDGGWDWLWIVTPLDTEACNFLSAKLQEMRSHDSGEPEWVNEDEPGWVHEDSFCYIVFNAAKKSNTKFHLKFENGQRNIKNYGKGANNKIIIEKILSLEAENAETIESGAFVNGVSLRKIYLPKVKKLGDGVFIKCTNLEEINLPNAEKIGETGDVKEDIFGVFRNCEKLHEVILPKARMIGNRTFAGCHSLEELILLKAETIEALAFVIFDFKDNEDKGCKILKRVVLPEAKEIMPYAFKGCENLETVQLPSAVNLSEGAFWDCKKINNITLNRVESVGKYAFCGCVSLTSISLPSVLIIEENALLNCTSLVDVTIPSSAIVNENAFAGCHNIIWHYLDKNGGEIPQIKNTVLNDETVLAIDNEAQIWNEKKLLSFFENLGDQEKSLDYALTMGLWEPEQDISIASGTGLDVESVYKHIERNIVSEFGDEVLCERKKAVFLLTNGQTETEGEGVLFRRKTKDGPDYAALYTIVFPLSIKRFTVQIYTLYLSQGKDAAIEGQQALSLKQNADPVQCKRIKALRDTIIVAINESANAITDIYRE